MLDDVFYEVPFSCIGIKKCYIPSCSTCECTDEYVTGFTLNYADFDHENLTHFVTVALTYPDKNKLCSCGKIQSVCFYSLPNTLTLYLSSTSSLSQDILLQEIDLTCVLQNVPQGICEKYYICSILIKRLDGKFNSLI
jgi:hypothetical protein